MLIVALAVGCSQSEAARRAGCDRRTVGRRMKDPAFASRLTRAKDRIISRAATRASAAALAAVATLSRLMKASSDEGLQIRAADLLLNQAAKLREAHDHAARFAALEAKFIESEKTAARLAALVAKMGHAGTPPALPEGRSSPVGGMT